ncbi:MAG: hypothetical protein DMF06_15230 [Verrucomicrobia bacterium]|nr:MAG: hypothetical protein DMF06_15230 [Verrucomicrobiota bacterium]
MLSRAIASVFLLLAVSLAHGQDAVVRDSFRTSTAKPTNVESAWLDLRQTSAANSKPQAAPDWVEALNTIAVEAKGDIPAKTVFRIRLTRPRAEFQVLFFRLFFDDRADREPQLVAWDESGTQVLQSGPLGSGTGLATSESVMVPMVAVSTIDIEVPGDGKSIRGAFLDWMATAEVLHPIGAEQRDLIPEPFTAMAPLHAPAQDKEMFGTVTATLADETIRLGETPSEGAGFQFGLETQPLMVLLSFEVASPNIDAPPQIFVNGEDLGVATLTLPDLADPAYRGQNSALVKQMRFQYTGWVRAQKLLPASVLKVGDNSLVIVAGAGTPASAIRATQLQLKYLWDKTDYQLQTDR